MDDRPKQIQPGVHNSSWDCQPVMGVPELGSFGRNSDPCRT